MRQLTTPYNEEKCPEMGRLKTGQNSKKYPADQRTTRNEKRPYSENAVRPFLFLVVGLEIEPGTHGFARPLLPSLFDIILVYIN